MAGDRRRAGRRGARPRRRTPRSGSTRSGCCRAPSSRPGCPASRSAEARDVLPHLERLGRARVARRPPDARCARATPMMHGVRGSIVTVALTSPARPAFASRRTPSGLPSRPRSGRSRSRCGSPSRTRCAAPCRAWSSTSTLAAIAPCAVAGSRAVDLLERGAQRARGVAELRDRVLVDVEALERALLRGLHRERRVGDHPRRVLARLVEQLRPAGTTALSRPIS